MLSRDELWEWATNISKQHKVGLFYILNQFELNVCAGHSHEKAIEQVEKFIAKEKGK